MPRLKSLRALLSAILVLSSIAAAQKSGGGTTTNTRPSSPTTQQQQQQQQQQLMVLYGQVQMEDGAPPPEGVAIRRSCTGSTSRKEAYTDSRGYFTLMLGQMMPSIPDASDQMNSSGPFRDPFAGTPGVPQQPSFPNTVNTPQTAQAQLWNCELTAEYPGYRSDRVSLAGIHMFDQQTHVRTIILHRMDKPGEPLVSLTSLKAPNEARKHFDKGQEALTRGSLNDAAEQLEKAVKTYPDYAVAWVTLGEVYERQGRLEEAHTAYENATRADSKYITPYVRMANVAAVLKHWPEVLEITDRLMMLENGSVPHALYLNAAASFNLGRMEQAEKSVLKAQQLDTQHRIPRIELLLGYIEARKGNYSAAAEHLQAFVKLEPHSEDSQQIQERIVAFQRAGAAQTPGNAVLPGAPRQ